MAEGWETFIARTFADDIGEADLAQVVTQARRLIDADTTGGPREPYLRDAGPRASYQRPTAVPDGWVAEPIGFWAGRKAEIVYDPRRHAVTIVSGKLPAASIAPIEATGWNQHASDGRRSLWVRDKLAATHAALDRLDTEAPVAERAGRDIGSETGPALASPDVEVAQ